MYIFWPCPISYYVLCRDSLFWGASHDCRINVTFAPIYAVFVCNTTPHGKHKLMKFCLVVSTLVKSDDFCHHSSRKTLLFCEKFILRWQLQFLRFCMDCLLKIGKQISQFKRDVALQPIWPKVKLIWGQCCGRALLVRYWQRLTKWPTDGLACLTSPNYKLMKESLWNHNLVVGKQ